MRKPYLYPKPEEPIKPSKMIDDDTVLMETGTRCHYYYNREQTKEEWENYNARWAHDAIIKLEDLINKYPDLESLKNLYITIENEDDYSLIVVKTFKKIPNPDYKYQMERYNNEMVCYKHNLSKWKKDKLKYEKDLLRYKKNQLAKLQDEIEFMEKSSAVE